MKHDILSGETEVLSGETLLHRIGPHVFHQYTRTMRRSTWRYPLHRTFTESNHWTLPVLSLRIGRGQHVPEFFRSFPLPDKAMKLQGIQMVRFVFRFQNPSITRALGRVHLFSGVNTRALAQDRAMCRHQNAPCHGGFGELSDRREVGQETDPG